MKNGCIEWLLSKFSTRRRLQATLSEVAAARNPFGELIKDELEQISQRQEELKKLIENQGKEVRPLLIHPTMALRYRKTIKGLRKSLKDGKES